MLTKVNCGQAACASFSQVEFLDIVKNLRSRLGNVVAVLWPNQTRAARSGLPNVTTVTPRRAMRQSICPFVCISFLLLVVMGLQLSSFLPLVAMHLLLVASCELSNLNNLLPLRFLRPFRAHW